MAKRKPRRTINDVKADITSKMLAALKEDLPPWRQGWAKGGASGMPRNFQTKRRYSGINPLILMWTARSLGFRSCHWGTSNAWQKQLGAKVKLGQKGTQVVFYKMLEKKDKAGAPVRDEKGRPQRFPMLAYFTVFNTDQMEAPSVEALLDGKCGSGKRFGSLVRGLLAPDSSAARTKVATVAELQKLVDKYVPKKMVPKDKKLKREELAQLVHDGIEAKLESYRTPIVERNDDPDYEPAEELIAATGANVTYGSDEAAYLTLEDRIIMPDKRSFHTISHYYEAHFHELAHWTEPDERVGRKEGHKYAFGELVADMAACMVLTELGVPLANEMTENSKSYIKSWIKALESGSEDSSKFIFDAATQAGKVMDYLLAFVGKANPKFEEAA